MLFPLGLYLLGVFIGLARIDGSIRVRFALALAWPLGPIAFALTIAVLGIASLIAFPLFGAAVAALLAGWIVIR